MVCRASTLHSRRCDWIVEKNACNNDLSAWKSTSDLIQWEDKEQTDEKKAEPGGAPRIKSSSAEKVIESSLVMVEVIYHHPHCLMVCR
jgi:hypothetical protein